VGSIGTREGGGHGSEMNLEMMERGGRIWLELSSAVMELGRWERMEGCPMAQVGEEEEAGGFEMASKCFSRRWRAVAWPHAHERRRASDGR
jgi:hypothetical protein